MEGGAGGGCLIRLWMGGVEGVGLDGYLTGGLRVCGGCGVRGGIQCLLGCVCGGWDGAGDHGGGLRDGGPVAVML